MEGHILWPTRIAILRDAHLVVLEKQGAAQSVTPFGPIQDIGISNNKQGTAGTLSFAEIESIKAHDQLTTAYDEAAAVKYMAWDQNQWVSYDDVQTLKAKVDFANQQG
jgi:chitinase